MTKRKSKKTVRVSDPVNWYDKSTITIKLFVCPPWKGKVEGVYTTKKAAQIAMKLLADTAKSEFGYPFDDDFTIETDTVIGFGSDSRDFFSVPNTECFEIFTRELLDGGD